jgi:hypothetical protein
VFLWFEVLEGGLIVDEDSVFVELLAGVEQVQFCLKSIYFLNEGGSTFSTMDRWWFTMV